MTDGDGGDGGGPGPDGPSVPPSPWASPHPTHPGGYGLPPASGGGQPAYGQPFPPGGPQTPYGYGPLPYGYGQQENHGGATTSMVLGIVALSCLALSFLCCGVTAPGVLCAPVGWFVGVRAKRAIDASQGRYGNRGMAEAGVVMGVIGTVLGVLALVAVLAFFGYVFSGVDGPY